jgi:hypothetical protein
MILPLPAGEGWGEGERIEKVAHPANANTARDADRSPSPFIPLPPGEGDSLRTLAPVFAVFAPSRVIVF